MAQLKSQIDMLLTKVSSGYFPKGYISEMILPEIGSAQSTGKLGKYGHSHLRLENARKAGRGKYRRVEPITRSTDSFSIEGHGLEGLVTKEDRKNVLLPFKAEEDETMGLTSLLWTEKEYLLASALADTAVLTQNVTLSGSSQFSDYLNSDPLARFKTARLAVRDGCGVPPDTAVMDWSVWNTLRFHPQILDSLGYKDNRPGGLTESELASAMGVKKVLLGESMYNSAKQGQADVLAAIWGKHIVFGVMPEKAVPYQVSLGYMVRFEGEAPRKVYKYAVNNPPQSTGILVEDDYDMLISNAGAGYLIKDAIA